MRVHTKEQYHEKVIRRTLSGCVHSGYRFRRWDRPAAWPRVDILCGFTRIIKLTKDAITIAIRASVILLAFCITTRADNVSDLRTALDDGLPFAAAWNCNGFTFPWHVDQVKQGRRLYPSILCPAVYGDGHGNSPKTVRQLAALEPQFAYLRENGLPILLRYNNVAGIFPARPRLPKVPESIPLSPLVWELEPDGSLNDTPAADVFGPSAIWEEEGMNLAVSGYVRELQARLPEPAAVLFCENNEGSDIKFKSVLQPLPKQKGDTEIRYGWLPLDEIAGISLRFRDRVAQLDPAADCWDEYPNYSARRSGLYSAFHDALKCGMTPAWADRLKTVTYSATDNTILPPSVAARFGPALQADPFDAYGPSFYVGWYQTADLTDPSNAREATKGLAGWEQHEQRRPGSFRELFLFISDGAALYGSASGKYETITPARWQALCEWLAWTCHRDGGGPLLMHYWNSSKTKPTAPFFEAAAGESLIGITHGDYARATALACDRICENAELRDFWLHGTAVPVSYPPGPVQIWRAVLKHPDGRVLLYCWTPCLFGGQVTVPVDGLGDVSIDFAGQPSAYQVYAPPEGGWQWRALK